MSEKARSPNKPYVQFSKRMVVTVITSTILVTLIAVILCATTGASDESGVVAVVKTFIGFAMLVFAAYSGNSAIEKWLLNKYKSDN